MKRFLALLLSAALLPNPSWAAKIVTPAVPVSIGAPMSGVAVAGAAAAPTLAPTLAAPSITAPSLALPTPSIVPRVSGPAAASVAVAAALAAPAPSANAVAEQAPKAGAIPALGAGAQVNDVQAETVPTREGAVGQAAARSQATLRRLEAPEGTPKTVAELSLEPEAGKAYQASPIDWRDEILYSVMADRFARSKRGFGLGDPKSGTSRHGGDIQGIIEKLDYIKASGVTAIILSPVTMGIPEAYHGYAPTQLLAVDPHLGTMADYKKMVAEAHKRGIKVIMDLVMNHTGPIFEYKEGSKFQSQGRKEIGERTELLGPEDLIDEDFTRRGVIDDWNNHDQATHGDFPPNYRHLDTERPETQEKLIKLANWWIKETDVDGVRLDAIRHMDSGFVIRFAREVKHYAASLGKKNFLMLPENSTGVDGDLVRDMALGMDSGYNYPEFRRQQRALHGRAPTRELENSFQTALGALAGTLSRIVRFIDLHDTYRFLRQGEPESLLRVAFAFLLFSTGIPLVYYGTEQAFRQYTDSMDAEGPAAPADPQNREDMFAEGEFKSESSKGDKFDVESASFKALGRLAQVRKDLAPLRRGKQYIRWSDTWGAGIYAFSRIHAGEEVLVVMNTSGEARSAEMFVDSRITPADSQLGDALDAGYGAKTFAGAEGGSKVRVSVPAHGVRVLVRRAP
ncbi:MAG: hypothetical protein HYZ75_00170 [Elusimicrobia bacterium]|nr:hypothetical protein [Elusimicrobiota bacterium]